MRTISTMDAPVWPLEVTALTEAPGVRLGGEIDLSTLPLLEMALGLLVGAAGDFIVDLAKVTFIDVRGLKALASAAIELHGAGGKVYLRGVNSLTLHVLGLCGWNGLFEFTDSQPSGREVHRSTR